MRARIVLGYAVDTAECTYYVGFTQDKLLWRYPQQYFWLEATKDSTKSKEEKEEGRIGKDVNKPVNCSTLQKQSKKQGKIKFNT